MINWDSRPLEECIERVKYEAKIPRSQFLQTGAYPVVSQEADFINGFWDKSGDLFKVDRPVVIFGDHTQVLKYVDFDFVIGADGVKVLKPRTFLDAKYFYYFLRSARLKRLGYARHYRLLAKVSISYPPLSEQKRIVAILDETFEGINPAVANAKKNLASARELFDNYLNSVFAQKREGWTTKRIVDVCTLKNGTTVNKDLEKPLGEIPYLKVADMTYPGNIDGIITSSRFLDSSTVSKSSVFPCGTVIFPKRGGAIMTNKKRLTKTPICTDLNIMGVIPSSAILPEFLYMYFLNIDMRTLGSGSSIPQINNYDIEPLVLTYPESKAVQAKFIKTFNGISDAYSKLKKNYEDKLTGLAELKQAILQKAFAGELTGRSADDVQEAAK